MVILAMLRPLILAAPLLCFAGPAFAQLQIIPRPKQAAATDEKFPLRGARIVLADPRSEEDRFAAEDFMEDLRAAAGVQLQIGRPGRRDILIGPIDNARVRAAMARLKIEAPRDLDQEGYVLASSAAEVVVAGRTAAGTFYGVQTLKQLVRGQGPEAYIQGARIVDWPTMRWRAVSDDISRGPVPTLDYIKRQLRTFAYFKINMHSFYMENVFASRAHPLIGPEGAALTPEQIRQIVAYARKLHIEIVPEQQTFGHLHKVLKIEKYNSLAETPYGDVLTPQQEGTYKLIADWYAELDELFPGKFFHIGADETFELGQGQSRDAVRERGVGAVYFEHLRRVRGLLERYGRRLMFWGDIALNHPDLIGQIPRDMIVMNWHYGPRQSYMSLIKPFKDAGLDQFVCPGAHNWNQIFPNYDAAAVNITNFIRDGQQAGAMGAMNTTWDDDGETLFEMAWYGIALGAAAAWQPAPFNLEEFERDFDWAFFRAEGNVFARAIRALGSVNALLGIESSNQLFWQEPFTTAFQERARALRDKARQMRLMAEEVEETILRERGRARRNMQALDAMLLAARRFDHMGRRMQLVEQLSRHYWDAYLNLGDPSRVRSLARYTGAIYNDLREMAEELSELKRAYRDQWLRENRNYWLESVLARYDAMIAKWLNKSRELEEALRNYERRSVLPAPEDFGLGPRPNLRR